MAAPEENYVPTDDELQTADSYDVASMLWFIRGYLRDSEDFQRAMGRAWASYQRTLEVRAEYHAKRAEVLARREQERGQA